MEGDHRPPQRGGRIALVGHAMPRYASGKATRTEAAMRSLVRAAIGFGVLALILAGCDQPKPIAQASISTSTLKAPTSDFMTVTKIYPNEAGGVVVKLSNGDEIFYDRDQAIDIAIHWRLGDEIFEKTQDPKDVEKNGADKYWNKGDGWWVNLSEARRNSKTKE
jgi:hypothetical protein